MPQRRQYFESAACWSDGRARAGSSRPKVTAPGRSVARSPTCGSSALTTSFEPSGQLANGRAPALGDALELSVAVELVAEEVREADDARAHAPCHVGKCALVDLEQPQLGVPGGQECRGDAGNEVRARAVVREPHARREDLRDERGRCRLAVRGRHDRAAERQARGQRRHGSGIDRRQHLARNRRPAAASGEPRQAPSHAGERDLER